MYDLITFFKGVEKKEKAQSCRPQCWVVAHEFLLAFCLSTSPDFSVISIQ